MSQDSVDSSEGQHKNANHEENVGAAPSVEQLRKRAFELFVARQQAGIFGSAAEDWLQAERELTHVVEQNYVHRDEAADNVR